MFIKPGMFVDADGETRQLAVRDHVTKTLIPADGLEVPDHDLYWNRLLRDGDGVRATPPAPEASERSADA